MSEATIVAFILGSLVSYLFIQLNSKKNKDNLDSIAQSIIIEAELHAKKLLANAEESIQKKSYEFERDNERKQSDIERKLFFQKESLRAAEEKIQDEKKAIDTQKQNLLKQQVKFQENVKSLHEEKENFKLKLESIAKLTEYEAKNELTASFKKTLEDSYETRLKELLELATKNANDEAIRLIQISLARVLEHTVSESSIEFVDLPYEGLPGKIIGKEGRNKKAFEDACGVTLTIDQNKVFVSSFDPLRRYIAIKVLKALFEESKIYPEIIETRAKECHNAVAQELITIGKEAAGRVEVLPLHPELLRTLGKLKFRISLGQNVLTHSIEVAKIMKSIAAELKLDPLKACKIGLLHDIGKALPLEFGSSHALAGYAFAISHGESEEVASGIGCHHDEMIPSCKEAFLCKIADSLSAARPHARSDTKDLFLQRIHDLEAIALQEKGVRQAIVFEGGKELHVFVNPSDVDDIRASTLAKVLKDKIEGISEESGKPFPSVRVTIVREQKWSIEKHMPI